MSAPTGWHVTEYAAFKLREALDNWDEHGDARYLDRGFVLAEAARALLDALDADRRAAL